MDIYSPEAHNRKQMNERDARIVELTKSGLPARKVRERMHGTVSVDTVQRIARKYVGKVSSDNPSIEYQIPVTMRPYIDFCMAQLGKDPYLCEICGEPQTKKCDVHHTKYEGATIYDLRYACRSCNCARAGHGLR